MAYKRKFVKKRRGNVAKRHPVMKAVAKRVVKTALSRTVERKRLAFSLDDITLGGTTIYYKNLLAMIPTGTAEGNRIGGKISNVRLNLALTYAHMGRNTTGNMITNGSCLRVLIIKTRRQLTTTGSTWSTVTPPFSGVLPDLLSNQYHIASAPVNTHDYTVLYDRSIKSGYGADANPYPRGVTVPLRLSTTLAKQFVYSDSDPSFGKTSNIYIVIGTSYAGAATTDYAGTVQTSGYLTWTDA